MTTKSIIRWVGAALLITVVVVVIFKFAGSGNAVPSGTAASGLPPVTASDFVRGATSSPNTLIEYSDFQCPACEYYYPMVEQMFAKYQNSLEFVYRNFPLPQHPHAEPAARAAVAAGMQGQFWGMYHLLFEHHADWTDASGYEQVFESYANQLGLDMTKFRADYNASSTAEAVQRSEQGGVAAGVDATPTFFLNGHKLSNPSSLQDFESQINAIIGTTTATSSAE